MADISEVAEAHIGHSLLEVGIQAEAIDIDGHEHNQGHCQQGEEDVEQPGPGRLPERGLDDDGDAPRLLAPDAAVVGGPDQEVVGARPKVEETDDAVLPGADPRGVAALQTVGILHELRASHLQGGKLEGEGSLILRQRQCIGIKRIGYLVAIGPKRGDQQRRVARLMRQRLQADRGHAVLHSQQHTAIIRPDGHTARQPRVFEAALQIVDGGHRGHVEFRKDRLAVHPQLAFLVGKGQQRLVRGGTLGRVPGLERQVVVQQVLRLRQTQTGVGSAD